ncbi:hypothetical protein XarjCFBP7645_20940 [Xanthomonas arboricola]|uniref:Uncharacterized protein n=2 Tax=Xanthomonas arboricola TaxID=56448 RepID=A0A2S6YM17_9XANT|nr:hypothetical protein XarjCFBP7652_21945 [Xanthomonas arboricola]PPU05155.1 hypothetical protein XarjCFBP7645_20940 [Xanthomonas arboricola]
MHEAKIDIKIADDLYQQSFAQAQRALAEITAENESGTPNQARLASLCQSFEHHREQYASHSEERNDGWARYNSNHQHFARAVLEEVKKLGQAQINLTCAIRTEAGMDTDASELRRRLEENFKRASHAIDETLRKFIPPNEG